MTKSVVEEHEIFLLEVNSPKKLVEYFIKNFIQSNEELDQNNLEIVRDVKDYYFIKISGREIGIGLWENKVIFTVLVESTYVHVLRVEYENSIPRNVDVDVTLGRFHKELKLIHLEEMMNEIFNN